MTGHGMTKEPVTSLLIIWRFVCFVVRSLYSVNLCWIVYADFLFVMLTYHLYLVYLKLKFWLVIQKSGDLGLFVIDADNETLLLHRISSDDIYHKQGGILMSFIIFLFPILIYLSPYSIFCSLLSLHLIFSDMIISWKDPEFSTELALSFQETSGCSHIW